MLVYQRVYSGLFIICLRKNDLMMLKWETSSGMSWNHRAIKKLAAISSPSVTLVRSVTFNPKSKWLSKCIKCWFLMYPDTDSCSPTQTAASDMDQSSPVFFWLSGRRCQVSSIHCICSSDFRWKWILAQDLQDLSWKTWPKMPKSNKHTDLWVRNWLDNHGRLLNISGMNGMNNTPNQLRIGHKDSFDIEEMKRMNFSRFDTEFTTERLDSWDATKKIRAFHQQNSLKKAPFKRPRPDADRRLHQCTEQMSSAARWSWGTS